MVVSTDKLSTITKLYSGAHNPDGEMCVMEAVAFVAGEKWSDKPDCACPVLASFARIMNDFITDDALRTRLLLPLVSVLVGSKSTQEVEQKRAALLARWAVRVIAPIALRAAKLDTEADKLAALPEDVDLPVANAAANAPYAAAYAANAAAYAANAAANAANAAANAPYAAANAPYAAAYAPYAAANAANAAANAKVWVLSADILRKAAEIKS